MAILAQCPICRRKQSNKNKLCNQCGENLDKAKRSKRVTFWINYRLPGGKQKWEPVGNSIEDAKNAESKRRVQKRENRFFEITVDPHLTFFNLTEWYLNLNSVKRLFSYGCYKSTIANFNNVFGDQKVNTIKPTDIENYQDTRKEQGAAVATIDREVIVAGSMVRKAWGDDIVSDRPVKAFKKVKNLLKRGANARNRVLAVSEYLLLKDNSSEHINALLTAGFNTGMRRAELLKLQWSYIDWKGRMIHLPAEIVKEKKPKRIPINQYVFEVLEPRIFKAKSYGHDFVFTFHKNPIRQTFRIGVQKACKRAGIVYGEDVEGGFVFRDMRTTFKTNMLRAGVDKVLRDVIVGHTLTGMDSYYLKPTDEDLRAAMDKFTKWLKVEIANVNQNVNQAAVGQS